MDKLLSFLWRYNYFLFFLIFFSFSIYLLVLHNQYQHTRFFTRYYEVSGRYNSLKTNFFNYLHLQDINQSLLKENTYLRENNISALLKREKGSVFIQDTVYAQKYTYIPAMVTKSTTNLENNYLIIDQGSNQGVEPEMGVITSEGIVGTVRHVSANFSSVLTILNSKSNSVASIEKTGYEGRILWNSSYSSELLGLSDIAIHAEVEVGDTITSGNASLLYPKNTPVGVVYSVEKKPGEIFCDIKVKPFVRFKSVRHVYVINNLYKNEEKELEKKTIESLIAK